MSTLLIQNLDEIATVDNNMTVFRGYDLLIDGPRIKSIEKNIVPPPDTKIINGSGKVALPGFVNTHNHMFQIYTRDLPRMNYVKDMFDWLTLSYKIWHEFDPELVYLSTLVGLSLLLKTGCTLSSDQLYIFPNPVGGEFMDAQIQAAKELGVRFHPSRGSLTLDLDNGGLVPADMVEKDEDVLLDYERLVNTYHDPEPFSMLRIALSPNAPFTVTTNLMRETIKFARKHGLYSHTHLAEGKIEEEWTLNKFGMRPFEYMESLEWVGPDVWYAHAIDVNDDEIKRMGEYQCGVASCPVSNARYGNGLASILKMDKAGVKVSFGTDGSGGYSDMIAEMQIALHIHRDASKDRKPLINEMLRFGTKGGAQVLGCDEVGTLEPGKAADITLIDGHQLDYAGCLFDKVTSMFLYGANHIVDTTIVNGEVLVENGKLTRIDEEDLIERTNRATRAYIERASKITGIDYTEIREL